MLLIKGARMYANLGPNAAECSFAMLDSFGVVIAWHDRHDERAAASSGVLGRHVSQFYVPEDILCGLPERELHAAAAGSSTRDGWHRRPAGGVFWGTRVIDPVVLRDGRLQGFSFMTRTAAGALDESARRGEAGYPSVAARTA